MLKKKKIMISVVLAIGLIVSTFIIVIPLIREDEPELSGKVVAIWSKGAGKFVRSPGYDDGILKADRESYDDNNEGKFLCFAEQDDTIAIMDVMLERYLTHNGGVIISGATGNATARRFTLDYHGNSYYALKADTGNYVRVDSNGILNVDADVVNDDALFAIVPIRTGPDVVIRAYKGWEADLFSSNPADFPVNKVNIGTLQTTVGLSTETQFTNMSSVWNTNKYETEYILPYTDYSERNFSVQVDQLVDRIKHVEAFGYTFEYVILYHEIMADLPGGPWSDPRVSSQEELDAFNSRVTAAYNEGELNYPNYKVFAMPYQFTENSLMGMGSYQDTIVGCDAATLEFIKLNYDGIFLELNAHDYKARDEVADAAAAAVWCQENGLEFGITSGGIEEKDKRYKSMYGDIFEEMEKVGFDKSSDMMHYILHHVYQPYENRLPEWKKNTVTENSKWLIENVMPLEIPSISESIDTDGDGVSDLQEAIRGTYPFQE